MLPLREGATSTRKMPNGKVVNKRGAFCPHCGNRNSIRKTRGMGCLFMCFLFISMGLALLLIPFLPKEWHCLECKNKWS